MKKIMICMALLMCVSGVTAFESIDEGKLNLLEVDAQKTMQGFYDLSKNMSIAALSESIVSHNAQMLESALKDLINLNKTVNSQVNVAMQFWNMYLDTVSIPTMENYLLGQVINSLIGTIRALSLRTSADQAMMLSMVKSFFKGDAQSQDVALAVDARSVSVGDRWNSMHIMP